MKKNLMVLVITVLLILNLSIITMAEDTFQISAGYNAFNNDLAISYSGLEIADINTPNNMYTVKLGYNPNEWLSLNAMYSWGTTDLFSLIEDLIVVDQKNSIAQVEGALKWKINDKFTLACLLGYSKNKTTAELNAVGGIITGDLKTELSGFYLGPELIYTPNDRFEGGIAYRYMIDPDIDLSGSAQILIWDFSFGPVNMNDPKYSSLEVYVKSALSENWNLKGSYTYTWNEFSYENIKVDQHNRGLSLLLEYEF